MKEKAKLMFLIALYLLSFVFFNIFISTILFIFKISVSEYTVIGSFIVAALLNVFFIRKDKAFKKNFFNMMIVIIIPILIIIFSIFMCGKILDTSFDGNSYQKAAIGKLKNGWNPLYEHLADFEGKENVIIRIGDESPEYIDHYARASNIFAANIYKLTGNIECGKSINTISIIMIFLFTLSFLMYKNKKILFSILFSICVATYPVISMQFLTNYLDLLVYVFLYLTIFLFFVFEEDDFFISKGKLLIPYVMILSIAINIKVSLFAYAGIFCMGYFIWYIVRALKREICLKFFKQFIISSVIAVLLGVFIIGLAVYPKNFIEHGHPFYPLMGENKIDIMVGNEPSYFNGKTPIEKFIISNFSRTADIIGDDNRTAEYKIPFTFNTDELYAVSLPDTRIAGNGILFGGILLISMCINLCFLKRTYIKNKNLFFLCAIPLVITVIMIFTLNESWWARYFPQSYLIVLFALILLYENANTKTIKVAQYVLIGLLIINNGITFMSSVRRAYNNNVLYNMEFLNFENSDESKNNILEIYTKSFHGAKYNILDKYNDKYDIIFKDEPESEAEVDGKFFGEYVKWRCLK